MTPDHGAAVELLTALLRAPSPCGSEEEVAGVLESAMSALGFDVCRDDVGNVVGRLAPTEGAAGGEVVLLGHMDTVPGWIPVEQRGGKLYGRGAVDAKGPLATAVVAAARTRSRSRALTVIGAVQEEGPSVGAHFLARRPAPAYLVIAEPSGWDAVVLGYKGSMRGTLEVTTAGGHSAGPLPGACELAVGYWNELVAWCAARCEGAAEGPVFYQLTPSLLGMSSRHDGLEEVACLQIGLRLPPGIEPASLQAELAALLPGARLEFSGGEPAVRSDKRSPLVAPFLRAIRAEDGTPRLKLKTGTSDMNVVGPVWGCPAVAYGPGDSSLDHTPQEHVEVEEYLRGIRVLTHVLEEL